MRVRRVGWPAGRPRTSRVPVTLAWVPTIERISVDLPQPEGPRRPVIWPRGTSKARPRRTVRGPRATVRPSAWTAGRGRGPGTTVSPSAWTAGVGGPLARVVVAAVG